MLPKAELTGLYKFEPVSIENFDDISVKLEDKHTGLVINLIDVPQYTFTLDQPGEFEERFVLHFNETLGIDEDLAANEKIRFYCYDNKLHIIDDESESGIFRVFDLTGQLMMEKQYSKSNKTFALNLSKGFYIVKIANKNSTISGKIYNE